MALIHVLDSETIDKIAAGEVVERPASVVKELVENAVDAGATAITVEAKDGGIEFIRITDNGSGMPKDQIRTAFFRHATSKIENAADLNHITSLGFRGEALSSIAAVSKVEVITKTEDSLTGIRYTLEGAVEKSFEEVGAPQGTTFLVRNLFFNTPVRRKFLKQPATEGGYIADLMEHLALSRPDISFKFILGSQVRFHTSGNGDLKEVIYRIYGRETAAQLVPIQASKDGIRVEGYLGKPMLVRSNRNYEVYFLNGRFIKSQVAAKAVEEGYKEYLMQHKFPLCVLHISMDTEQVDVNVHPTKMDVRFSDSIGFFEFLSGAVKAALKQKEMIPEASLTDTKEERLLQKQMQKQDMEQAEKADKVDKQHTPEPFEAVRTEQYRVMEETKYQAEKPKMQDYMQNPIWNQVKERVEEEKAPVFARNIAKSTKETPETKCEEKASEEDFFVEAEQETAQTKKEMQPTVKTEIPMQETSVQEPSVQEPPVQMNLFEEKMLSVENRSRYRILGQAFDTYWLVQFEDKLFIIDQHAAHEKVKYERLMKQYEARQVLSQGLMPPIVVTLTGQEEAALKEYEESFAALGFEVESFGGSEYTIRSVPADLYGCGEKEMFLEVLDEIAEGGFKKNLKVVEEKIASMSCKAAVKGNNRLSMAEAEKLIDELLTLENPYHCPHGRPTIISMSQTEIEKKFKRIV